MRKFYFSSLIVLLLSAATLQAGWTRAGLYGADVRALVADPKNPDLLYLGTSQGEVYVSSDGAATWSAPRNGTPFPGYIVDNLTIDGEGRLWVAAWGLWGGGVIAVSGDGGANWSRRDQGLEEFSVRAIAHDARNPDRLLVGGLDGVHESRDVGKSWKKISEQINVESLAIDPREPKTIFVGTWRQGWRSDDGGKSWKHIEKGMVLDTDMFSIHLDPKNPDNVWVATCGWVYNSKNRGDEWTRYRDGFKNRRIHDVDTDPFDQNIVYAGSVAGLYRSVDGGKLFDLITDESIVVNSIVLHPQRADRIILGTEGDGVYVSDDRGKSFRRANLGLYNVRVATVVSDPGKKDRLFAAVVFGNAASGVYESNNAGLDWQRVSSTRLPEILSLVVQTGDGPKFVAGTEKGFYWSKDGIDWTLAEPTGFPLRVQRIVPYSNSRIFGATSEGVFTSKDGGRNWYRLAEFKERTLDVAVGRLGDKRALFALTAKGLLAYDGEHWLTIGGTPAKGSTLAIRTSGEQQLVVIGSANKVHAGRVDARGSWADVETPAGTYAGVHQASGRRAGLVVLAPRTDRNIVISTAGDSGVWRTLAAPLDPGVILGVATDSYDERTLYFGTMGHGLYIYREGTPLRAVAAETNFKAGSK